MKHGTESYFIKGEGLIVGRLFTFALLGWIFSFFKKHFSKDDDSDSSGTDNSYTPPDCHPADDPDDIPPPTRQFCRIISKGTQPSDTALVRLGELMESEVGTPADGRDSNIPAGYTYLGQFIDHDITLDRDTALDPTGTVEPETITNFRTPSLDLDSLYLDGPASNPELYEADGKSFKIGQTTDTGEGIFDNDLPRSGTTAVIGDGRNDENLIVAQTHLAFLKFHNARVAANPAASFEDIRREVTLHYQAIVLTDFLPRVIDPAVLTDVITNGRQFYTDDLKDCMPVEFSVAAYRMGHSMVRPTYEWNRIFTNASFALMFEFSGGSGSRGAGDLPFAGSPTLPSNWIADWRRMYDLGEAGGETHPGLNFARKLDAQLAMDLKTLPEFEQMGLPAPLISLATRNLLRGRLVSLPTGQEAAAALGVAPLTSAEVIAGAPVDQLPVLTDENFDTQTPLWYYILREAMVQQDGNRLGAVGSRIVAETFIGLIENSSINLLTDDPTLTFSMPELLMSLPADINPLGD